MTIYDRWGSIISILNNINQTWNGSFRGEAQAEGVYMYRLSLISEGGEHIERGGSITLIR